ncbi:MAG: hypothetical protein KGQ52_12375 [Alphaproteobacteria bacterium]|nr:hypothetical protein [Alphaproteobacteria bacterium]
MPRFLPRKSLVESSYHSSRWPAPPLFLAAVVCALALLLWLLPDDTRGRLLGPALTATIAAVSLVYSLGRNQEAGKDQYTLSLVSKRFDDGGYAQNVRMAADLARAALITDATSLKQLKATVWVDPHDPDKRQPAAYAIYSILNYWEHVCTAYVDDRINRQIFEDLVQDLIRDLVSRYPAIIGDMRREDPTNMEHLCAVWFVLADGRERATLARRLGPVPERLPPFERSRWEAACA